MLPPASHEVFTNFRQIIIENIGHAPSVIKPSGKLERFSSNGKSGDLSGWYVCHEETILITDRQTGAPVRQWGVIGVYGDWRQFGAEKFKWNSFSQYFELSREEKARIESRQRELSARHKAERQANAAKAQQTAIRLWNGSTPASSVHPYLIRKGVGAYGIRQHRNSLILPLCDLDGLLHSIQFIQPDGEKRFLFGTPKKEQALFCLIGEALTNPQGVYICEGYATGASLYEAYGLPVLVAFDAGNLQPVATAYRQRFPHVPLTLCADNDRDPTSKGYQVGLTKARDVCANLPGVGLIVPEFPAGAPLNLSDFNDLTALLRSNA